jgi:hypothetical protein
LLHHVCCHPTGAELLAEGLAANSTLISLDLSNNSISSAGAVALAEALHSDKCVLSELQLANNKISEWRLSCAVAGAAAGMDATTTPWVPCDVSAPFTTGDEGAEALAAAVAASALRKLTLQGNPISPAQLQVVSHVLKTREYRVPSSEPRPCGGGSGRRSSSSRERHIRKASSHLQFDIEVMRGVVGGGGIGTVCVRHVPAS